MNETTNTVQAVKITVGYNSNRFYNPNKNLHPGMVLEVLEVNKNRTQGSGLVYTVRKVGQKRKYYVTSEHCVTALASEIPVAPKQVCHKLVEFNFQILKAALQGVRAQYLKRYLELSQNQFNHVKAALEAVGMNMTAYAPYPDSRCGRREYMLAQTKRAYVQNYFETVPVENAVYVRYSEKNPVTVREKTDTQSRLLAEATQNANNEVDSYITKMAVKIESQIESAVAVGDLWYGSVLTVNLKDGSVQQWNTKCILNQSCLGKLFNQWPTRKVS